MTGLNAIAHSSRMTVLPVPISAWPELRRDTLDADLLVIGTPIWLGRPSSIAKRVLERLDAFSVRPTARVGW
jgi:multimeric flavodoxin WrbA